MSTTPRVRPLIADDDTHLDLLTQYPATEVHARNLKPGMVLLDDVLGIPAAVIDHRLAPLPHRSGAVAFFAQDMEDGRYITVQFHANKRVKVAAA